MAFCFLFPRAAAVAEEPREAAGSRRAGRSGSEETPLLPGEPPRRANYSLFVLRVRREGNIWVIE